MLKFATDWIASKLTMVLFSKLVQSQQAAAAVIQGKVIEKAYEKAAGNVLIATLGTASVPAIAGLASVRAAFAAPSFEEGGPTGRGGFAITHPDEYILNKMQTEEVSRILSDIRQDQISGGREIKLIFTGGDGLIRELIGKMNIEIEDNGVRSVATVLV